MAYFRVAEARQAFRQSYPNRSLTASAAKDALQGERARRGAARFDIFLSHSSDDAVTIAGIKAILERDGSRVYVDWMDDPQLDRSRVSAGTADLLRKRMKTSASLVYVSSKASPASRWMPWELGYFDGMRPGHVAILPLVEASDSEFTGIEFVGLYPKVERDTVGRPLVRLSASATRSVTQFRT
jgi:hypothetical protein